MISNRPPRFTDNRHEWAMKVLSEKVPEHQLEHAWHICVARHMTTTWDHLSKITPRLIARNWNKKP